VTQEKVVLGFAFQSNELSQPRTAPEEIEARQREAYELLLSEYICEGKQEENARQGK
jgi:hypothetical protein